jgi:hypothetical protein
MNHLEETLQIACVRWFRLQYRQYDGLLFHVPNGGVRSKREAAIFKAEGVTAGVADLLLLVPSKGYHGLAIEMKTEKGRQSPEQKQWQKKAEQQGYRYAVCRSLDDFMATVNDYLKPD